eukprot:NODE_875_length_3523_cov_0.099007.p3 type:complete len:113 gc:universal NODE_875_length_3523_cov_0.099007:3186-2848(-)
MYKSSICHASDMSDPEQFDLIAVLQFHWLKRQEIQFIESNENLWQFKKIKSGKRTPSNAVTRLFNCRYPGCNKSYGTISHLNTHRKRKGHGEAQSKRDFLNESFLVRNMYKI